MTEPIPEFVPFDETAGKTLLAELDRLSTFQQVADWDQRAADVLGAVASYLESLTATEAAVSATAQRARDEHGKGSILSRMFSPPAVKAAAAWKERTEAARTALAELAEQLETAIDKTPNSRDDQRDMLRDLKLAKKELTLQRREASEAMRQTRTAARQQSAKVGAGFFGALLSTPTSRRYSRMAIRLDKESAVKPHENARAHLERQILVIDRAIHWIERFK